MSSIEDMHESLQAVYRNPQNKVAIWEAAALLMDVPPKVFNVREDDWGNKWISYGGTPRLSDAEESELLKDHASMSNALINFARRIGHSYADQFTELTIWDVMQWWAGHDATTPKIWKGIDLHNPVVPPSEGDLSDELVTFSKVYPFLDKEHPHYSPELAAAVHAWLATASVSLSSGVKGFIERWLELHQESLDISGPTAVERIAIVVNWNKDGGAAKAGSGQAINETLSPEQVKEQLGDLLQELASNIAQRQQRLNTPSYLPFEKIEELVSHAVAQVLERVSSHQSRLTSEQQRAIQQMAEELKEKKAARQLASETSEDSQDIPF